jgi:SEC-C motif-containing protein
MNSVLCSCDKQKPYAECCEPVIRGKAQAATAADLMRARYTAFVRQEIDFILESVVPARRAELDRKETEEWAKNTDWAGLEILSTEKGGAEDETGVVEFQAKFNSEGELKAHHEIATFEKVKGHWLFDDGRPPGVQTFRHEGPRVGRNDPCHCGSGKKFKKCHGKE